MNAVQPLIREIALDEPSRIVLAWMHHARATFKARAGRPVREPLAFDAMSALALYAGDVRRFRHEVCVLARTHTLAAHVHPVSLDDLLESNATLPDLLQFPEHAPAHVYIDAADFDTHQRDPAPPTSRHDAELDKPSGVDQRDAWMQTPGPVEGLARTANAIRTHALRHAHVVTVLPHDFVETGDEFTVASATPGWVALGAVARYAEIVDLRDRNVLGSDHVHAAAHFCLNRFLFATHLDRDGVVATIRRVASRDDAAPATVRWSGRNGLGVALDMFLRIGEQEPGIIDAIDRAHTAANMNPWGHEYARDLIGAAAEAAGMYLFEPGPTPEPPEPTLGDR